MKDTAKKIVQTLVDNGHVALFAGGCVRDMILGLDPKDIDIATSATPDEVELLFKRTIPVGKSFGVIVVLLDGEEFEVASFRSDGNYSDGRRPDSIVFSTPEEDAKRRDLTINGMFFNPLTSEIIDFVGGRKDLEDGIIRFIGNPQERIDEDRLRILRAIRFAAKFNFIFDRESVYTIQKNARRINDVSVERIKDELDKMLMLKDPSLAIKLLLAYGVLDYILPEVCELWNCQQSPRYHSEGNVGNHTMLVLEEARKLTSDITILWAALLHDIGKPSTTTLDEKGNFRCFGHDSVGADMACIVMNRMKASTEEKTMVCSMIEDHMKIGFTKDMKKSTIRRFVAQPNFDKLMVLYKADCLGCVPLEEVLKNKILIAYDFLVDFISKPENVRTLPEPLVNGRDLIDCGMKPGPLFKKILRDIMDLQLEGKITTKEEGFMVISDMLAEEVGVSL
jgi:putative nucleotidyltransferase with HDIG domain